MKKKQPDETNPRHGFWSAQATGESGCSSGARRESRSRLFRRPRSGCPRTTAGFYGRGRSAREGRWGSAEDKSLPDVARAYPCAALEGFSVSRDEEVLSKTYARLKGGTPRPTPNRASRGQGRSGAGPERAAAVRRQGRSGLAGTLALPGLIALPELLAGA